MSVFEIAMQMELDGMAHYQRLASESNLPGLKTIFTRLAEDEEKHYETFKAMKEGSELPELEEGSSLVTARSLFANLPKLEKPLHADHNSLEAYKHAMQVEAESQKFYENAAKEESDPQIRATLLKIAAEEQRHFEIMENVYQFINAPNQYLAGAEISNLEK